LPHATGSYSSAVGLPEGSPHALSRAAVEALPFKMREVVDQARYTALPRDGTGVSLPIAASRASSAVHSME
jgi:hypothetical protein